MLYIMLNIVDIFNTLTLYTVIFNRLDDSAYHLYLTHL